jgi:Leucine-rich repeat (LRR) protein
VGIAEPIRVDLSGTNLSNASLDEADLWDADLSQANLSHARLQDADLRAANLSDANLSWAFLLDAKGVTKELLKQEASALGWAFMPEGQQYVTAKFEPALSFSVPRHRWLPSRDTSDK